MSAEQAAELKDHAAKDNRSVAQFALMMYLRGLCEYQAERAAQAPARRKKSSQARA
ncbi:hypothetical protein [Achromobacter denitrificans]|uniref:hypothetical protein n=1 Tax=Achromobacter denitrificans TaxID=32002 RepID=UPI00163A365B|nr:hypothetical protein [Achromobacter denitrificans]